MEMEQLVSKITTEILKTMQNQAESVHPLIQPEA